MPNQFVAKVESKTELLNNIWILKLKTEAQYDFVPGQYISIKVTPMGVRRSYSVADIKKTENGVEIDLLIDVSPMGLGSRFILNLKPGDAVNVVGYIGRFVVGDEAKDINELWFVATGTGIAPMKTMIESQLANTSKKLKLIWGVASQKDLYWMEEFATWKSAYSNFDYEICLSREVVEGYNTGRVQKYLFAQDLKLKRAYYICGLSDMVEEVKEMLIENGVDEALIISERYA